MRRILPVCILLLLIFSITSIASAKFNIPNYVYTVNQLKSVRNISKNNKKPIAFVFSDKNTDCSLAAAASNDLFQSLHNYSVVVYADRNDWANLPAIVKLNVNSPDAGKYIPITVVVDHSFKNTLFIIPYAANKERKQLIHQAQQILSSY